MNKMAFSLLQIKEYFDDNKVKYEQKDSKIIVDISKNGINAKLEITAENPEIFRSFFYILDDDGYLTIENNHPYLKSVIMQLMLINYETTFGAWEYNFTNSQIRYAIELPLIDAKLTLKQFSFIYENFYSVGIASSIKIQNTLKNGLITNTITDDISELLNDELDKYIENHS